MLWTQQWSAFRTNTATFWENTLTGNRCSWDTQLSPCYNSYCWIFQLIVTPPTIWVNVFFNEWLCQIWIQLCANFCHIWCASRVQLCAFSAFFISSQLVGRCVGALSSSQSHCIAKVIVEFVSEGFPIKNIATHITKLRTITQLHKTTNRLLFDLYHKL